jgi:circadian clock protein KaiC
MSRSGEHVTKKIKTGIKGLDEILKGGIMEKSAVLISGGPGTGKTIFTMQFLIEGAKRGELGLAILYDTTSEEYLAYADSLSLPLRKYWKEKKIFLIEQPMVIKRTASIAAPLQMLRSKDIKRVSLDSLTMFAYIHVRDDKGYRAEIISFLNHMNNITLLATAEAASSSVDEVVFRPEEFLFDGVIFLTKVRQEASFERVLHVHKMRSQDHLINIFPFFIQSGGIQVYPDQLPFALMEADHRNSKKK